MIHSIRPWQLFAKLGSDNQVNLRIPTIPSAESLTIFSLETLILIAAARVSRSSSILEIGTSLGYTSLHLAMNLPAATVTTVDIDRKPALFEGTEWEPRISRLAGDTTQLTPAQADFVFIDADHSYRWVKQDTKFAFQCAPKVVAWHDYCRHQPGNVRWLTELSNQPNRELIWVEDSWIVLWFKDKIL